MSWPPSSCSALLCYMGGVALICDLIISIQDTSVDGIKPPQPPYRCKCDLVQIHKLRHPGQICLLNPSVLPIKQSPFPQDLPAVSLSKDSLPGPALSFLPHSVNFFARNKPARKEMLLWLRMRF